MSGPWEQYAQQSSEAGPWQAYAPASPVAAPVEPSGAPPSITSEISGGVVDALKAGGSAVASYLNPFSEERRASYKRQAEAPSFAAGLGESMSRLADTGGAVATPLTVPANVAGEVLTPLVAHPFYLLHKAIGTDISYEKAREDAATAISGARPAWFTPAGPIMKKPPLPSGADLKKAAVDVYNDPSIKAIKVQPSVVAKFADKVKNDLVTQGFRSSTGSAPGTFDEINRLYPSSGNYVYVDDLRAARRALNMTAKQVGPDFKPTPDAAAAKKTISEIDNFLDALDPRLRKANANYAAGKSSELIDYRKIMADRRAAKTGSGSNIENTLRQEVDKIPGRGLSKEAQALKEQIVTGDVPRNVARKIGKLGFSDGLSLMLHGGAAVGSGGLTVPIGVVATGIRKVGEALTRSKIRQLSEMIRSGAPAAQGRPMVSPKSPGISKIIAAMLERNGYTSLAPMVPSYAEDDQQRKTGR